MKSGRYTNCNCRQGQCPKPTVPSRSYLDKYYSNRQVVVGEKKKR